MSDEPLGEINRVLAEHLNSSTERCYECICCDTTFGSGRKARQHALSEHDDLSCYNSFEVGGE